MQADREQLASALAELLANAATAAGTSGPAPIRLWARPDATGERVVLAVSDNGPGMDARSADAATTPFYSSQAAGRRRGLGLSKARRYAEINGGSLRVTTTPGEGTTVRIELPATGSRDEGEQRTDDGE
jgi:signal transduction histidine kinase